MTSVAVDVFVRPFAPGLERRVHYMARAAEAWIVLGVIVNAISADAQREDRQRDNPQQDLSTIGHGPLRDYNIKKSVVAGGKFYLAWLLPTENSRPAAWHTAQLSLPPAAVWVSMCALAASLV